MFSIRLYYISKIFIQLYLSQYDRVEGVSYSIKH